MTPIECLSPDWPAASRVVALSTTRSGGVSTGCYAGANLALHVADDSSAVKANREQLRLQNDELQSICWLEQIHSTVLVDASSGGEMLAADASYTSQAGLACAVMTADCLPVLVCDRQGQEVAAIHAGWRGLVGGIIESSLARFDAPPQDLLVWLGPAIGQQHFEVGEDVREAFLKASSEWQRTLTDAVFRPNLESKGKFFADLYVLARLRLQAIGVSAIYGGDFCTYADEQRFYSYRRESQTGRMASLIYLKSV